MRGGAAQKRGWNKDRRHGKRQNARKKTAEKEQKLKVTHLGNFGYTDNQVSVGRTKNLKPLFNRNMPPKPLYSVIFWLNSDCC